MCSVNKEKDFILSQESEAAKLSLQLYNANLEISKKEKECKQIKERLKEISIIIATAEHCFSDKIKNEPGSEE